VRRWKELVIDREKWKDIVRQAKSPQWAVVPMEEEEENCILLYVNDGYKYESFHNNLHNLMFF